MSFPPFLDATEKSRSGDAVPYPSVGASRRRSRFPGALLLSAGFLLFLTAACAGTRPPKPSPADADHVRALQMRLSTDSTDVSALRELGAIYAQQRRLGEAGPLLDRACRLGPCDARTGFYLGLYLEAYAADTARALQVYGRYAGLPRSRYRRLMAGRYTRLTREVIRRELRRRLAHEAELGEVDPNTLAVFPFTFLGENERFAPLGRGLSALMLTDLGRIERVTVVERLRLQVLLDELALAGRGLLADGTAPRLGRLLGAGRVVGGTYTVSPDERLRLDLALRRLEGDATTELPSVSDALRHLFAVEKDLVFRLVDAMGLVLTPEERERIEFVPTRNLQAFLAYSQGLEAEDAGRYAAAAGFFGRAVALDPGFSAAAERAERIEGVIEVGTDLNDALGAADPETSPGIDELLLNRQLNMGWSLGGLIIPGQDAREPLAETGGSLDPVTGAPLAAPPVPPARNGSPGPPPPPPSGN
ncbi:CsgG/HfaB family protein [Rhodocaloribacter sp.]